jgi:hypothetical protein
VEFISNNKSGEEVYYKKTYKGISESQCAEPLGGVLGNNFTFSLSLPRVDNDPYYLDKIRITTSGTDGFMIDALKFEKTRYYYKKILNNWVQSGTAWDDVQKWGVNKGGAWCLSGDATDADRTWKGTVSACYRYIEFDIKTGKSQGYH